MIKSSELARLAQTKVGCGYVYGTLGQTCSETLIQDCARRNKSTYTDAYIAKCRKNIGKQVFDCVGLIKFFVMGNTDIYVPSQYKESMDISANMAYTQATVKNVIRTIPETPGVCVRLDGHIGIYIGDGYVIEARGVDYGVVRTKLSDRPWTHWIQYPGVDYSMVPVAKAKTEYQSIIQAKCKFSDPAGVWRLIDSHPFAMDLYKKWANSYV